MTAHTDGPSRGVEVVRRAAPAGGPTSAKTGGRVVYAVGDVHGRYDLLVELLEAIVADVATLAPADKPLLIFVGDYVDRGPASAKVVSTLVWLSRHATVEVAFLRGNHEEMLLTFLAEPDKALPWLQFGGAETLAAYDVAVPGDDLAERCWAVRDALMDRLPASHLQFLRALPTQVTCGDYVFVHAGLRPGVPLARQDEDDLLWIRDEFLEGEYRFEKIVVHGHSWTDDMPEVTRYRIGIDTGAYATGVLTAVRLADSTVEFLQARACAPTSAPAATPVA
ncbi:metallophosphoesterase family protein [Sphingomonas lenta]|uniref:Metallophosphoesterase n=1 Tax=Sphingomonas lenta TaxID=1141887 RepID=A0A2A2SDF6_9SPHN|nr:metallophosphoesterase family protein [Sphingomonas lenta]PAX07324.1 metallophosphoesterase [Sphingomonas lenta]